MLLWKLPYSLQLRLSPTQVTSHESHIRCKMLKLCNSLRYIYPKFSSFIAKPPQHQKHLFWCRPAGLKWAFWADDISIKSKKQKNSVNQCRNYFLTSGELHEKIKILRLTLLQLWIPLETGERYQIVQGCRRKVVALKVDIFFLCKLTLLNINQSMKNTFYKTVTKNCLSWKLHKNSPGNIPDGLRTESEPVCVHF